MDYFNQTDSLFAQDLAGKAMLFEIGAKAGILEFIEVQPEINFDFLLKCFPKNEKFLTAYLDVLESLQLLSKHETIGTKTYIKTPNYFIERNKVAYLLWALISCGPLIENTTSYLSDLQTALQFFQKNSNHEARTVKWIGETDFYPHTEKIILNLEPKTIIDLGNGSPSFLIRLGKKIKDLQGICVNLAYNPDENSISEIEDLSLNPKTKIINSSIQALIQDSNLFTNVDIVYARLIFHTLFAVDETTLDQFLSCIKNQAPKAKLVIVDAVPCAKNSYERAFSHAFTFLHEFFIGKKLLSEEHWRNKLTKAGFKEFSVKPLGMAGGRIYIAS